MRGGEKCLEALCELYPSSPIYTLFLQKDKLSGPITEHPIHTSRLQHFPGVFSHYRNYLPFFAGAMEGFSPDAELIVSSSHCVAKGIRKPKGAVHICYCFTPVRYAWGFFDEYFGDRSAAVRWIARRVIEDLKRWDLSRNADVDHFIAISEHVRDRIRRFYGREAEVIYPPVDTDFYTPDAGIARGEDFLIVSALVPYKRVDIAIEAFNRLGKRLIVIGDGPERKKLEALAGPTVSFGGWRSDETLRDHYRRARALIFPGEEDFGIVPVEAQACGCPVIAYRKGGALETVEEGSTGIFFNELNADSLIDALRRFDSARLSPRSARANSERFSKSRFKKEIAGSIARHMNTAEAALR